MKDLINTTSHKFIEFMIKLVVEYGTNIRTSIYSELNDIIVFNKPSAETKSEKDKLSNIAFYFRNLSANNMHPLKFDAIAAIANIAYFVSELEKELSYEQLMETYQADIDIYIAKLKYVANMDIPVKGKDVSSNQPKSKPTVTQISDSNGSGFGLTTKS